MLMSSSPSRVPPARRSRCISRSTRSIFRRRMVELNKGDHVGLLFEDPAEQLSVAAEFIKEGIRQNERCLYIADERTQDELAAALRAAGIDVEGAFARGALSVVSKHDSVFGRGTFNAE